MLRLKIKDIGLYEKLSQKSFIKDFIICDINSLPLVTDKAFFIKAIDHIRVANGTFKTTKAERFDDLNRYLITILDKNKTYRIHDVAVSDGSTTSELISILDEKKVSFELVFSDKFGFVSSSRFGLFSLYFDSSGHLIYGSLMGIVADRALSNRFVLSKLLGYLLPSSFPTSLVYRKIWLLNPALNSWAKNGLASFKEIDIFNAEDMKGNYDIIRCMNVLNKVYFSDKQIAVALENVKSSLVVGGVLIVGRTDIVSGKNHATIFERGEHGIKQLQTFNLGSEISGLVYSVFGSETK